jgi:hypothetical protein
MHKLMLSLGCEAHERMNECFAYRVKGSRSYLVAGYQLTVWDTSVVLCRYHGLA